MSLRSLYPFTAPLLPASAVLLLLGLPPAGPHLSELIDRYTAILLLFLPWLLLMGWLERIALSLPQDTKPPGRLRGALRGAGLLGLTLFALLMLQYLRERLSEPHFYLAVALLPVAAARSGATLRGYPIIAALLSIPLYSGIAYLTLQVGTPNWSWMPLPFVVGLACVASAPYFARLAEPPRGRAMPLPRAMRAFVAVAALGLLLITGMYFLGALSRWHLLTLTPLPLLTWFQSRARQPQPAEAQELVSLSEGVPLVVLLLLVALRTVA